jgi:glutamine synthetase
VTREVDLFLEHHPQITTVEVLLPDFNGVMRGKWLPANKLKSVFGGALKLPYTALSLDIWGRDIAALVFESGDADAICKPVEGSLLPVPWVGHDNHAQLMLSLYNADETPYLGDLQHILSDVLSRYQDLGWQPVVAVELEFSLVQWDGHTLRHTDADNPSLTPIGGNTYGIDSLRNRAAMLEDLRRACELQQLPYDGVVKESGPSQYEINMRHVASPLLAARQILLMKRLIKGVAHRHGLTASFMAKPFTDLAGNGMHAHCSVLDAEGRNIFDDGSALGTPLLRYAIGGCLEHMADCMAVLAPNHNSYRRFQTAAHAPVSPSWGIDNRTVAVRIPAGDSKSRRLEHRVAGADVNPYLLFAVILAAMKEGMSQATDPGEPVSGDAYSQQGAPLPFYLHEALARFADSEFIARNLGLELRRTFTLSKQQEIDEFRRTVSSFEHHAFLERV